MTMRPRLLWTGRILAVLTLAGCPVKTEAPSNGSGQVTLTSTGSSLVALTSTGSGQALPAAGDCVAWAMPRCQHAGRVYAVGRVRGIGGVGLQRQAAASRARNALLAGAQGRIELRGSEVPLFVRCGVDGIALASTPGSQVPGSPALPTCLAAAAAAPQVASGCPAWTGRVSWREGPTLLAVAAVDGVRDPSLAARAGENRARAEAANVLRYTVAGAGSDRALVSVSRSVPLAVTSTEHATCGGVTYVKVGFSAPSP